MDGRRFDAVTRAFTHRMTRRGLVQGATGMTVALGLGVAGREQAGAAICRKDHVLCARDVQCCSGYCDSATHRCATLGPSLSTWVYDPDNTGIAEASISADGLYLAKNGETSANAAAGATIDNVNGLTLSELGFDYNSDGYCGAGAPRFNVYTSDAVYFFFGCVYGSHTDLGNGFIRIRFGDGDGYAADGSSLWPGFGSAVVTEIDIIFDGGPGSVTLQNIDVNGTFLP